MGKYQYMNLEQKMAKIRKKMPALLKKFHNDEADYDFATLDDIYESMTPALNKYGVNFDIVKETPTQYDSEGKPVYLTLDKDGFWRYESDMELCWTNIDNPKEERRAVIHMAGTNEIPDKAHGTAMTYGLKYYFRNKFCMRQLGSVTEDPDGMKYGTDGSDTKETENPSKDGKAKKQKSVKSDTGKQKECSYPKADEAGKGTQDKKKVLGQNVTEVPAHQHTDRNEGEAGFSNTRSRADRKEKKEQEETAGALKLFVEKKDSGQSVQQVQAEPDLKGPQIEDKDSETVKMQTDVSEQTEEIGDGFHTVSAEEVPFEDAGFMEALEQEMEEAQKDSGSDLKAAKNHVCTFGIYKDKTLGEMMDSGVKGREAVKWIANRYKGTDTGMINAAKLLLENLQKETEAQAA